MSVIQILTQLALGPRPLLVVFGVAVGAGLEIFLAGPRVLVHLGGADLGQGALSSHVEVLGLGKTIEHLRFTSRSLPLWVLHSLKFLALR